MDTFENEIAIVGMAGRFPGAGNIDAFWQNLRNGIESITFFSDQEALAAGIAPETLNNPRHVKAHGTLEDIDLFDAAFFGFSPREAEILDPQQRLFLECAWQALEDAGYDTETYKGRIGVYAGATMSSYLKFLLANPDLVATVGISQVMQGNDKDYVSTRVSYKLNLKGPGITIQTTCSTSLVAVHLASQSLLSGESEMALAGGVSIIVPQKMGYIYQEGSTRSPDGHCRAFDAKAQGMVGGSGVALVVLKRLSDALTDGNHIYAVIKGSAINNDGASKIGYTAPGTDGQTEVIAEALAVANINPRTVTYVETHGTATPLGDPIEIAALTQAFRARTGKKNFCAIGSVKTNIGHLDAAAGIAGLIKTVLALKHQEIPPSLHFEAPNPKIDFANSPFYVNTLLAEWKTDAFPRRAGVSSFGIGGTNAHVILEEAPTREASDLSRLWKVLILSAKTGSALETITDNLVEYLKQHPQLSLADVANTLQIGRRAFTHRRIAICQNLDDAISTLETRNPQRSFSSIQETRNRPIVFMFPGVGSQYVNMGLELYQHETVFREQIDRCAEQLKPLLGVDLRTILYPNKEEGAGTVTQQLRRPALAMPSLFIIEYSLAKLWMSWGIHPEAMIGHSLGEYVAACLAGVFSLQDALALLAFRGQLFEELPEGAMLSIPLPGQQALALLQPGVSLAASNGPSLSVISGPTAAIATLEASLISSGLDIRRVPIDTAAHSELVIPVMDRFTQFVAQLSLQAPRIPYTSNVTGTWITAQEATSPAYWATHLRQTVRFSEGIQVLLQEPGRLFLEVGPGHTLSMLARQHLEASRKQTVLSSLRSAREQTSELASLLTTAGQLWLAGTQVDWPGFYTHERRQRLSLPTYPFERQRYWFESPSQASHALQRQHEKLPIQSNRFQLYTRSWKRTILPITPGEFEQQGQERHKETWLLLLNDNELGHQLANSLQQHGHQVIISTAGTQWRKLSNESYILDPSQADHYTKLIAELRTSNSLPSRILHLWSITFDEQVASAKKNEPPDLYRGFSSLLLLTQALNSQPPVPLQEIVVLSNNTQEVIGGETISPQKATMLGACTCIPQEYPGLSCRSIDIELPRPGTWQEEKLLELLITELTAPTPDPMIAYRGNYRWVATIEDASQNVPTPIQRVYKRLQERGAYLIIDGSGDMGLVFLEYLIHDWQARLFLIEPLTFPTREEWESWLVTHDAAKETGHTRKIQQLLALEKEGADIHLLHSNFNDRDSITAIINQAYTQYGSIHGVISMAGFVEPSSLSTIQQIRPVRSEDFLQTHIEVLYALEQAQQGRQLDFCLICSSLSALFGGEGYVMETALVHLIDTFIYRHNQTHPISWVSVSWDSRQSVALRKQQTGIEAVHQATSSENFGEIFQTLLSSKGAARFFVIAGDLADRQQDWLERKPTYTTEAERKGDISASHIRPALTTTYVAPTNEIERTIAVLWQELLGIEHLGIYDDFFELGGHSLMAAQLIARLRDVFMVEIPLQSIFEKPTIAGLAEVAEEVFVEQLEQLPEEEAERLIAMVFHNNE